MSLLGPSNFISRWVFFSTPNPVLRQPLLKTKKILKYQNNELQQFVYILGAKKADEIIILVIQGQLLPQILPKYHLRSI